MLVNHDAGERTEAEYVKLARAAGFVHKQTLELDTNAGIELVPSA